MTEDDLVSRRRFTGAALAAAGLVALGGRLAAKELLDATAESPMGPFYPVQRPAESDADMTRLEGHSARAKGQVIEVTGRVLDRHGNPVSGARIEVWQANAAGRYSHPNEVTNAPHDPDFQSYALLQADAEGRWRILTVKPGGYDSPIGSRPPHIHMDISGAKERLIGQMYFPDEAEANARDLLYRDLGELARTSVARRLDGYNDKYSWDIVLS